jgi:hypothetical protein
VLVQDRRQNVRVQPAADYSVVIDFGSGLVKERLQLVDVAVGGVGLVITDAIAGFSIGTEIPLGVTLPGVPRFQTIGTVRYTQAHLGGRCGVHLNHLTAAQQTALSRAVSELLERGYSV